MTKHISYPSIGQYRDVVRTVNDRAKWDNVPTPKLWFHGTNKTHGTNASTQYNVNTRTSVPQSRERVISIESDNAGFAVFHKKNQDLLDTICTEFVGDDTESVVIFGEWIGKGAQKGAAVSQLDKKFIIFGVKVIDRQDTVDTPEGGDVVEPTHWWFTKDQISNTLAPYIKTLNESEIYHIEQFKTWDILIDFSRPELVQQQLIDWTLEVENECPVGKFFGVSGIGEGIVFRAEPSKEFNTNGLVFKSKGEKHSESKVKVLNSPDIEKLNGIAAFVDYAVTEYRLEKLFDKFVNECGNETTPKNTGQFVALVCKDVVSEEGDTLVESNLTWKDASSRVAKRASDFWLNRVNKF